MYQQTKMTKANNYAYKQQDSLKTLAFRDGMKEWEAAGRPDCVM